MRRAIVKCSGGGTRASVDAALVLDEVVGLDATIAVLRRLRARPAYKKICMNPLV